MTINKDDLLNSILDSLGRIQHIEVDDIPDIDLYMDQVTTFMDEKLKNSVRNPREGKILTKTMINNYAKNNLLPPPVKKKYSKEHVVLLIFIYYYKGILTISDIQKLLNPLTERFFHHDGFDLSSIYTEVFSLEGENVERLKEDMMKKFQDAQTTFQEVQGKEREFLQFFSLICMLSFDVYVKKLLIEKLIDEFDPQGDKLRQETKKEKG